jgi:hypothetical protein
MKPLQESRFNWRPSLYAVAGAVVFVCLIEFLPAFDLFGILYFFIIVPAIAITLLIIATLKKNLSTWAMFAAFCLTSLILWKKAYDVRTVERWALWSKGYQAAVLAQPPSSNGDLKHAEWDGWGWAGMDTTVYLVFDPGNALDRAARSHSSGKFRGIPCEVSRVRRLEKDWYSVVFYTDLNWEHCTY